MKAVAAAFNQEKALVGAFSVITNLRMELFQALARTGRFSHIYILITLLHPGLPIVIRDVDNEAIKTLIAHKPEVDTNFHTDYYPKLG